MATCTVCKKSGKGRPAKDGLCPKCRRKAAKAAKA